MVFLIENKTYQKNYRKEFKSIYKKLSLHKQTRLLAKLGQSTNQFIFDEKFVLDFLSKNKDNQNDNYEYFYSYYFQYIKKGPGKWNEKVLPILIQYFDLNNNEIRPYGCIRLYQALEFNKEAQLKIRSYIPSSLLKLETKNVSEYTIEKVMNFLVMILDLSKETISPEVKNLLIRIKNETQIQYVRDEIDYFFSE